MEVRSPRVLGHALAALERVRKVEVRFRDSSACRFLLELRPDAEVLPNADSVEVPRGERVSRHRVPAVDRVAQQREHLSRVAPAPLRRESERAVVSLVRGEPRDREARPAARSMPAGRDLAPKAATLPVGFLALSSPTRVKLLDRIPAMALEPGSRSLEERIRRIRVGASSSKRLHRILHVDPRERPAR
jgi:hypothetical protein